MNRLPTARSYQGSAQLVPGVSGGANPNVKGGFFRSNRYLVDGLDVTDPVTNTFSMNIPFEVDAGRWTCRPAAWTPSTTPWAA